MSLEFSHVELELWKLVGKLLGSFLGLFWIKLQKEAFHLSFRCMVQLDVDISSARSEKCWIKFFFMICSHDQYSTFLGPNTIQSIEQSREGDSSLLVFLDTGSLNEDGIDIFQKDDRIHWRVVQQSVQTIIIHSSTREIQVADTKV